MSTSEGDLARLGAAVAGLLLAVTESLAEPWQNPAAAHDTVHQIMALHDHLRRYLAADDALLVGMVLQLRSWAIECLDELGNSPSQAIEIGAPLVADYELLLGPTTQTL